MLVTCIRKSGLYDQSKTIRIGVVNDAGVLIADTLLEDPKFEIVYVGKSEEYERATLYHMRQFSELDDESTKYYYLHTKGLRHFGTETEVNVVDWIDMLLYWTIEKWQNAVDVLRSYDTYGCIYIGHYSGNFWWATARHIRQLPDVIGSHYNDPENWVCSIAHASYCAYQSGLTGYEHYFTRHPRHMYATPT
jgi:hypothetical protein